jgi:hypothetical protein
MTRSSAIYMALSAHSSKATYTAVHRSTKEYYPNSTMLSFVQVRNRLKSISGILPLHFDMCINSCMAFTGPFSELKKCLFCSEDRFRLSQNSDTFIPCCQFVTLPIGPQLQALWRHPITVAKLCDRLLPIETLRKAFKTTMTFVVVQNILILLSLRRFTIMTCSLLCSWMVRNFIGTCMVWNIDFSPKI